ncbi:TonB-dependent receptor [soil metagenome]
MNKNSLINMADIKVSILVTGLCIVGFTGFAQRDTTRKPSIDITSSYKPVLRNSSKINFSATNLVADSSKVISAYNIPAQNLFYTYQPVSLKPLALQQDTALELGLRNFVKVGFGNYTTPYASAGLSFGDGKTALVNLYGDFISSKGTIEHQDYTILNMKASGSYFTERSEIYGVAAIKNQDHYLYGYDHTLHTYSKDEVLQRFQDFSIKAGFRNKDKNETGINYDPSVQVSLFSSLHRLSETTFIVNAPVEKTFGDEISFKVSLNGDITSYTTKDLPANIKVNNNVFQIAPELIYSKPDYTIHGGITPAWDNGKLTVFPNIYGEVKIPDQTFLVQGGFVGHFIKNTYRNLSEINPYLATLPNQQNTKETELYGGIKTSVGKHFNFSAKAGLIRYENLPFYINDTATDSKAFIVSNESKVNDLRIHADLSFISQDKFTITGGLTFNGYTSMKDNDKAFGTIPLEVSASMRWWAYKALMVKADFRAYTGGPYLLNGNVHKTLGGAADLSAGLEYAINQKFSAWLDFNNIFNNKYERWHNYQVYGLNVLGGVIYKF